MIDFDKEKEAFGKRMTSLLIDNGFSKAGRGKKKGIVIANHAEFAEAYTKKTGEKLSYKSVEKWCKGEAYFETKKYPVICSMLNTNQEWIMYGRSEKKSEITEDNVQYKSLTSSNAIRVQENIENPSYTSLGLDTSALGAPSVARFVDIPIYDVCFSAGAGCFFDSAEVTEHHSLSIAMLEKYGASENDVFIAKVKGESMERTLFDGDTVLINKSTIKPQNNKIFAFAFDNELKVKRFFHQLDGSWRISSDNEDKNRYQDEIVSFHNIERLGIIGQVLTILDRPLI
jgi:phage repressor protein C with HTH and peptisase S24 domain